MLFVSKTKKLTTKTIMKIILRPGVAIPGTVFSVAGLEIKVIFYCSFNRTTSALNSIYYLKSTNWNHFHFLSFETTGVASSSSTTSPLPSSSSPLGFFFSSPPRHIQRGKNHTLKKICWPINYIFFQWFLILAGFEPTKHKAVCSSSD